MKNTIAVDFNDRSDRLAQQAMRVCQPEPVIDLLDRVENCLLARGIDARTAELAAKEIDILVDQEAVHLAAMAIRHMILDLGKTAAAAALQRALLGTEGPSLDQAALQAHCSTTAIVHQVNQIRERLGLPLTVLK
jgi:hypothetical protein